MQRKPEVSVSSEEDSMLSHDEQSTHFDEKRPPTAEVDVVETAFRSEVQCKAEIDERGSSYPSANTVGDVNSTDSTGIVIKQEVNGSSNYRVSSTHSPQASQYYNAPSVNLSLHPQSAANNYSRFPLLNHSQQPFYSAPTVQSYYTSHHSPGSFVPNTTDYSTILSAPLQQVSSTYQLEGDSYTMSHQQNQQINSDIHNPCIPSIHNPSQ